MLQRTADLSILHAELIEGQECAPFIHKVKIDVEQILSFRRCDNHMVGPDSLKHGRSHPASPIRTFAAVAKSSPYTEFENSMTSVQRASATIALPTVTIVRLVPCTGCHIKNKENAKMRLLLALILMVLALGSAKAEFPLKRPITIIIGVPAGGGADAIARLVAPKLTEAFGQPVVIEPRPGANYLNSVRPVATAPPDGHTLLLASSGFAMIAAKPINAPFDLVRDLTPLSLAARGHVILVASPKLSVNSVHDLIALAKANPGKLSFGSGGTGTLFHLAAEYFKRMTNTNMFHVPYKGSVPALQDVMGGHIDFLFDNIGSDFPHVLSGAVKGLAVTSPQRARSLP